MESHYLSKHQCNLLLWRNVGAFSVSQQQTFHSHQSQIVMGVLNVGHEQKQACDQSHILDQIENQDENNQHNRV